MVTGDPCVAIRGRDGGAAAPEKEAPLRPAGAGRARLGCSGGAASSWPDRARGAGGWSLESPRSARPEPAIETVPATVGLRFVRQGHEYEVVGVEGDNGKGRRSRRPGYHHGEVRVEHQLPGYDRGARAPCLPSGRRAAADVAE